MFYLTDRWLQFFQAWATRCIIGLIVCAPMLAFAQAPDEAAIRALVDNFFVAYQKGNINDVESLLDAKSPDFTGTKQQLQKVFTENEKIEIKGLAIRKLTLDGVKGAVRVTFEMSAVDKKTKSAAAGFGKMDFILRVVKEDGAWKVWQFMPSAEDMVAALVATQTEQERKALLAANQDLVTVELRKALSVQGTRLFNAAKYSEALAVHQLARDIAEQIGDKPGVLAALRNIGVIHQRQGNYPQSLEYLQKSLPLAEALGDKESISRLLIDIGTVYQNQDDLAQAIAYFQKGLKVAEELSSKDLVAYGLTSIGAIYRTQGDYVKALEAYQKSLTSYEELGDKRMIGITLSRIGLVNFDQGNYPQALDYFQKELKLGEELGNKGLISAALQNSGLVYYGQRNYARALEYFQKSLKIKEELGDKHGIANSLNSIGVIYEFQRDYTQALEYYRRTQALSESLGYKDLVSYALNNIGNVYRAQGDYAKALEYFQKCLTLVEERGDKGDLATALNNIGLLHRLQGNYAQALEYCQKSLSIAETLGNKDATAAVLQTMGDVYYYQSNHAKAIEFSDRAAAIANQIGNLEFVWEARTTAGNAYRALNQPELARQAFDEAIASIESVRSLIAGGEQQQEQYFENKVSPYQAMVELLVAQDKNGEALAYAERAKARVLLDVLRSGKVNIAKAMTAQEQNQELKIKNDMNVINNEIDRESTRPQPNTTLVADLKDRLQKARLAFQTFQTDLYLAHPALRVQRGEARPVTVQEVAALLPDTQTAFLEYVVTNDRTYLFVSTRNSETNRSALDLKAYVLAIKRKDLTDRAELFRNQLARRDLGFGDFARQLYDLLIKPAQTQINGKTTFFIIPDGALWELPFQALQSSEGRFLLEDHAISYVPSTTVLQEMVRLRRKRTNNTTGSVNLLAFGNPALGTQTLERVKQTLRDEKLQPLPETEKEVKYLAQLYGTARSKVYIGSAASEDRMKAEAPKFTILHLATHGILNDINPMYSQVVLSQGDANANEDGLLEAWEIMKMDLKADLVVLSACETARGRVGGGEGMIGLTWALFVAGSPTNVVSQWKVDSVSTTQLMLEFHRNLKNELTKGKADLGTAKALQQAAITLLRTKEYRHPFYWAGFVVMGDGF
jgi:CHAT domain-containing protein